jgi:anaerobic selenocysteine-containing dehydrogenase
MPNPPDFLAWQASACILCSMNCGLELQTEDGHIAGIRGDANHPKSEGYQCQKAFGMEAYQNSPSRVFAPLKRQADGNFVEIGWDQAIAEVAERLKALRDTHGGHTLAYYGGGGQGNHMGGAHSSTLRTAMGTHYFYNSLAQEKTGGFWVNGKLFGHQTCHPSEDIERADYVVFIGTNPWQSHGFPQARKVINALAKDPSRTLVVVDPRRTETAKKSDVFLQVRPGGDAFLMLAMLGTIVQEGLEDARFLEERTTGWAELREPLLAVDVDLYARRAGLEVADVRGVARGYAGAERGCLRTDLGLEHAVHSTLNTYLSKLLFLITGQFGKPGTVNLHSFLFPLIGHSKDPEDGGHTSRVTGMREIAKFLPPNILPAEIDTDHPERLRGLVVDSANPMLSAADSHAVGCALEKLELLVVIDVAMTETARLADYVLPVATQFEKWEATFFNLEFPTNFTHLRRPVLEPPPGVLTEPELYRRIAVAMGALPKRFPLLERIAKLDRAAPKLRLFPMALMATLALRSKLKPYAPMILHETLGAALPRGARAAGITWGACQLFVRHHAAAVERAGIQDQGAGLAEALFQRILESPSGTVISTHTADEMWSWIRHADGRVHLAIPELIDELRRLDPGEDRDAAYPFSLMAGERRAYNANTIIRESGWRKRDPDGALRICAADAEALGVEDGAWVSVETSAGSVRARVELTDELQPGVVSLPHGYGMVGADGEPALGINELTSADHCDPFAKTPYHKQVPARIRP